MVLMMISLLFQLLYILGALVPKPQTLNAKPCVRCCTTWARHSRGSRKPRRSAATNSLPPACPGYRSRIPKPGTRNPKHETRNTKPPSRKPEARDPKFEVRDPNPETRSPKHKTQNPKPETLCRTAQFSAKNSESSLTNSAFSRSQLSLGLFRVRIWVPVLCPSFLKTRDTKP